MNSHALRVLEYDRIREILTAYSATPLARAFFSSLQPCTEAEEARTLLAEAREMRELIEIARVPLAGFSDVARLVRKVAEGGQPADADLLYSVLELLRGARALSETLSREPETHPGLSRLASRFEDLPDLRSELEGAIDPREGLRDDASPKLAALRHEIRQLRESLRDRIQRKRSEDHRVQKALQSEGIKLKNDRYLLAVKAEFRSALRGVIRDRSASGSTLYVEPQELVLDGDHLLEILDDERAEAQRLLWELTRQVLAEEDRLGVLQDLVARVDVAHAKACYARAFSLSFPEIVSVGPDAALELELCEARHPYLLWLQRDTTRDLREVQGEGVFDAVVPLDIRLGDPYRLLIITGPNTGGKTVVLKTVGLSVLMALSGVPLSAAAGARIPMVSDLFADIGDEQSIEQNLSTFSSHLTHMVEIFRDADSRSLVFLDELGAGTDPLEGGALAIATLNQFLRLGWHAVITTHLTNLKEFAFANADVENAAMEFDAESLRPTFRLRTGLPGRSHALDIARRIGVPDGIVEEAESRVSEVQAPTEELIEQMVHSHRRLEKERRRMQSLRRRAQGERRAAEVERAEAELVHEVRRREAEEVADETVRHARESLHPILKKLKNVPKHLQPVIEELNWTVDLLLTSTPLGQRREQFARSLKKEDEVYVPKFRERCRVRKIHKGERVVTVLLNGIPTEVGFDDISWVEG